MTRSGVPRDERGKAGWGNLFCGEFQKERGRSGSHPERPLSKFHFRGRMLFYLATAVPGNGCSEIIIIYHYSSSGCDASLLPGKGLGEAGSRTGS